MITLSRALALQVLLMSAFLPSGRAESILDKKVNLAGSTARIYGALCQELAGSCGVFMDDSLAPTLRRSSFSQVTVSEVLRNIVPPEGPYAWKVDGEVLNIAPKYVFAGQIKPLARVGSWQFKDELSLLAAAKVMADAGCLGVCASEMPAGRYKKVTLRLRSVTTMQALNRVVEADGMAYWIVIRGSHQASSDYSYDFYSTRKSGGIRIR